MKAQNLRRYGITLEQYEQMLEAQGGVCAICGRPERSKVYKHGPRSLAVDHGHETGRIRGLLCFSCNTNLGKFDHDLDLLRSAIEYLEAT